MRPVDRGGTGVSGRAFCRPRQPVARSGVSSRRYSASGVFGAACALQRGRGSRVKPALSALQ
ncbi:hypothetical protein [Azospirillum endophyticum]